MAPAHKRQCSRCGSMHMRHGNVCWKCTRAELNESNVRHCALCGIRITRNGRGDRSSPYCSMQCSSAVAKARAGAIQIVGKAVREGRIKKAKELTCVDCGKKAADYDHREYLRPLDVVPVCHGCNIKRGPAADIKETVAKDLGIHADSIPVEMEKAKAKWDLKYQNLLGRFFEKAA